MFSVRVWTLESEYDREAVHNLCTKIVKLKGCEVRISSSGKAALAGIPKYKNGLERAVANYLKQDQRLVFVLDYDSPTSFALRLKQPNSLLNQVKSILARSEFTHRVFLVLAKNELEAWLLIDCMGIAGYFLRDYIKVSPETCHQRLAERKDVVRLIRGWQSGDTERFVEAEPGARNAKEELETFSVEVLRLGNPKLRQSDLDQKSYRESMAPEISKFIHVSSETLSRSRSLAELGSVITGAPG